MDIHVCAYVSIDMHIYHMCMCAQTMRIWLTAKH